MVRIFPYAVNRNRLEQAIQRCRVPASLVEDLDTADLIVTLKSQEKHQSRRLREAQARGVPLYTVRHNTVTQMEQTLRLVFDRVSGVPAMPRLCGKRKWRSVRCSSSRSPLN